MLGYIVDALRAVHVERILIVVGYQAQSIQDAFSDCEFALQEPQLGTGHAIMQCKQLADAKGDTLIINGDGRDTDLLIQEGIKDAQAFIALTENSGTNILACLAAKRFGVFKTIAKVENIDYIPMADSMDIGSVINKKLIAASHIYQFLLDADVSNVKCLTFANADVAELVARPGSKITRKPVKDLKLPRDMTLGGLIRNGEPMMIKGDTQIQAYDHVVVFCLDTAMRKLEDYFN